jgi:cyclase
MLKIRVIPCLLLKNNGLVKTVKFSNEKYIGDPINAVRIFNDKEVDELTFLDISASLEKRKPNLKMLNEIASECFMPLSYGGGITSIDDIKNVLNQGVEKVVINSFASENPDFIKMASDINGSSTIVVSIDVKRNLFGKYVVYSHSGKNKTKFEAVEYAIKMENMGAGEILLNSIDRDGTMSGYDVDLIKSITSAVGVPVIACGGAGNLNHFREAVSDGGASAVAAGSMFVFHGPHRAVLISYPSRKELEETFN